MTQGLNKKKRKPNETPEQQNGQSSMTTPISGQVEAFGGSSDINLDTLFGTSITGSNNMSTSISSNMPSTMQSTMQSSMPSNMPNMSEMMAQLQQLEEMKQRQSASTTEHNQRINMDVESSLEKMLKERERLSVPTGKQPDMSRIPSMQNIDMSKMNMAEMLQMQKMMEAKK